jgi:hypothetical protein
MKILQIEWENLNWVIKWSRHMHDALKVVIRFLSGTFFVSFDIWENCDDFDTVEYWNFPHEIPT